MLHRAIFVARIALVASAAPWLGSCNGEDDTHSNTVDCDEETRDEAYTAGMGKTGEGGLTFTLISSNPAPPSRNNNVWVVKLERDGVPVEGATIDIKTFMPDHNHGSPVVPDITATATPGQYNIDPVNLFMPGLWEITVEATAGATTDEVVFRFCIPS